MFPRCVYPSTLGAHPWLGPLLGLCRASEFSPHELGHNITAVLQIIPKTTMVNQAPSLWQAEESLQWKVFKDVLSWAIFISSQICKREHKTLHPLRHCSAFPFPQAKLKKFVSVNEAKSPVWFWPQSATIFVLISLCTGEVLNVP